MRFTARSIDSLKPGPSRREIPDELCPGLYLVLQPQPSTARSWAVRYRRQADGRPRKLTLGAWPLLSLADAREKAREALRAAAEGGDPAGDKQQARPKPKAESRLFEDVLERFLVRGCGQHRTQAETRRLLEREVLPHWRGRLIETITRPDVTDVLYRLTDRGTLVQANRVFSRTRRMFRWCVETGVLEQSPVTGLRRPAVEHERERVLSDDELAAIWGGCEKLGWPFGPAVQMLILTAQRRDEVALAEWAEIDLDAATWTIPGARMKNGETHTVPLSPAVLAILQAVPRFPNCPYIFTARQGKPIAGFSRAKATLDRHSGVGDWKLHDLRRTAATGMARLGVPPHVADKVLGHKQGTIRGVAAIYNRHAYLHERRAALNTWAGFVKGIVDKKASKVVPLADRQAVA